MNQTQINKQYIRQHVSKLQQPAFYQYFTQLHDVSEFNNWNGQRTIEVVNDFNLFQTKNNSKNLSQTNKIQIIPHPQNLGSSIDNHKFNTTSKTFTKDLPESANRKTISALSLLQEIEKQMVFTPLRKTSKLGDNKRSAVKLQKSDLCQNKTQQSYQNETKVSKNFNTLIPESKKNIYNQQSLQKSVVIQTKLSSSQCEQRFSLQRSVDLKRQKSDTKNSIDLKQKKNSNIDRVFKQKLNQLLPCRKLSGKLDVQKVMVSNHEMFHRYFLPDYVIYHILVLPCNLICKRTYNQFLDFRSNLQKMFPCVKIPYMDSGSWFSQSDIALINKNKANLQLFLNQLILHPTLSKTDIVREFLTIPDVKDIESNLQTYSLKPPIKNLSEITNETGVIKVVLSEQNNKLIQQLPRWQKYYQNYFDKYTDLVSNLTSQYQSIKLTFNQMVALNYDFRIKITQVPQLRTIIGNFGDFQELLQKKQQFYDSRRKEVEGHIQNLKEKLSRTLKYEKLNVSSFQTVIQSVKKLTKRYLQRLENQPQSPSSGLQTQKITASTENFAKTIWDQTQNFNLFKYQVGYLNSKIIQEMHIFNIKLVSNIGRVFEQVFRDGSSGEKDINL